MSSAELLSHTKSKLQHIYLSVIQPNLGISLLLLSQCLNSVMILTCKLLESDKDWLEPITPVQILFARMSITYVCCVIYMLITKRVDDAPFGPKHLRPILITRGVLGFLGVFGLYFSLQYLSLSDAVAITFLIPLVTPFFAWIVLNERYSVIEAVCAVLSFGGILLIAKPDFIFGGKPLQEIPESDTAESSSSELRVLATVVALVGVCGASSVYVVLRKIGKAAHPLISVSYFALVTCVICFFSTILIPSLSFQVPLTLKQWFLFILIGLSGFFMQFCLAAGLQREKAGRSSLMIYSNMIFALFWDFVIWNHVPGLLSMLGTAVIVGNAYLVIRLKPTNVEQLDETDKGYRKPSDIELDDFILTDDESD